MSGKAFHEDIGIIVRGVETLPCDDHCWVI
jgi:hypothetical protein